MTESFLANFDLQAKNALAVPSSCRWFKLVTETSQLSEAVAFARDQALPLSVLGSGTNVVLGESINAVVLQIALKGRSVVHKDIRTVIIEAGAGEDWHELVSWSLEQSFYGLENLALIPGTCGAAPIQNIGAYGVELGDLLDSVEIFDLAEQKTKRLNADECELEYRDSIFKHDLDKRAIVISVRLRLNLQARPNLSYPALADYLKENEISPTPENVFEAVCAIRRSKLPDPVEIPNVGSFFKNPTLPFEDLSELLIHHPGMPYYELPNNQVKIPAAWFVDQAGFKGWQKNGVGIHDKQALVLVNPGKKSCTDVLNLAEQVSAKIYAIFGVELELEPRLIA